MMMDEWFECRECCYGTNSLTKATIHERDNPGHTVEDTSEDDESFFRR